MRIAYMRLSSRIQIGRSDYGYCFRKLLILGLNICVIIGLNICVKTCVIETTFCCKLYSILLLASFALNLLSKSIKFYTTISKKVVRSKT